MKHLNCCDRYISMVQGPHETLNGEISIEKMLSNPPLQFFALGEFLTKHTEAVVMACAKTTP